MIELDEDLLICDFAETYGIYDFKSLPPTRAAIYAVGLREDSRIKLKMNGLLAPPEMILLASAIDRLSMMVWMQSEDGRKGRNKPEMITDRLFEQEENEAAAYNSPEEYEAARRAIVEGRG